MKRQKVIEKYIVDFCIDQVKLVIEIDGSQHYIEAGEASDKERDAVLKRLGYTILRFSNLEVNRQYQSVCDEIEKYIATEI